MSWKHDIGRVRELLAKERGRYALGLLALLLVNMADAVAPAFLALSVDLTEASLSDAEARIPGLFGWLGFGATDFTVAGAIACFLVAHVLANVMRYPMIMNTAVPSHRVGQALRRRLGDKLLRQSASYYDRAKSGDLMSLATADVTAVRMMVGPGILVGSDTIMLVTLVLLVMLSLSPLLTLIALIPLPLAYLVTHRLSHLEFDRHKTVQADLGELAERARESVAGARVIQAYAREPFDAQRFADRSWRHTLINLGLARVVSVFDPSLDMVFGIANSLVFLVGGGAVLAGDMSLGTFVAFLFLVNYLSGPVIGFGWSVSLWQRGRASLQRLDAFEATEVAITDPTSPRAATGEGRIEVTDLSFRYEPREGAEEPAAPALQGVSFCLEPGQRLGVVGSVGSGKSTLARLLVRLYEPPAGAVKLDGVCVRDLPLGELRETLVLAPQETFLFSDTVAQNLLLGAADPDTSPERFATYAAVADEIAALPAGYETILGERGVDLSGGQRQRVAIARAIATDPKVLILDDCLSAVDARTEDAILDKLDEIFSGRSGVVISHRIRAVQRCDQIIVLEQGRVAERGSHAELCARGGPYAHLVREQVGHDASEEARAL